MRSERETSLRTISPSTFHSTIRTPSIDYSRDTVDLYRPSFHLFNLNRSVLDSPSSTLLSRFQPLPSVEQRPFRVLASIWKSQVNSRNRIQSHLFDLRPYLLSLSARTRYSFARLLVALRRAQSRNNSSSLKKGSDGESQASSSYLLSNSSAFD